MDEVLSWKEFTLSKLVLLVPFPPIEIGSVPKDDCHWVEESRETRFSSNSSESGHIKSKSISADRAACCSSTGPCSHSGGADGVAAVLRVVADPLSDTASCPDELGLRRLCLDAWLAGGEGHCEYSVRVCSFSWRARAS